ncbi:hypothetical protein F5H01DRAFT_339456 [Linnemannia elongata]|nr:hypothetical protein F5H01DRAFT_339456 [Linnemannia elongata]
MKAHRAYGNKGGGSSLVFLSFFALLLCFRFFLCDRGGYVPFLFFFGGLYFPHDVRTDRERESERVREREIDADTSQ